MEVFLWCDFIFVWVGLFADLLYLGGDRMAGCSDGGRIIICVRSVACVA